MDARPNREDPLVMSGPESICPACGGALAPAESALKCARCTHLFAVVAGIPDLRLVPDADDVARARALAARFDEFDFTGLLREGGLVHEGSISQNAVLRERFVEHNLRQSRTAAAYLDALERERGTPLGRADRLLEIGCGTGALATAAAARGCRVVALDISMRVLVLAKKRLSEAAIAGVRLACCDGERPAFPRSSFEVVAASDVIEHTPSPDVFVAACSDLLVPDGLLFLATPNRFSLSLEPHVRLWGVGFLPRRLALRYVRAVRKVSYDTVRPLSARQLRRLLVRHRLRPTIVAPEVPVSTQGLYRGLELRLVRVYNRVRTLPLLRPILLAVGPFFHVFGRKTSA
jgi:SAM-dependent methyltransferase